MTVEVGNAEDVGCTALRSVLGADSGCLPALELRSGSRKSSECCGEELNLHIEKELKVKLVRG
jgi:hypothetical protein